MERKVNTMIIEVTLENGLTFAQEFVDRSTRDWYVPDVDINTICRHSFSVSELDIDLIDKFTILELRKEIELRRIHAFNMTFNVKVSIDSVALREAMSSIDKVYFANYALRAFRSIGRVCNVGISSYVTHDGEIVDCSELVFGERFAKDLLRTDMLAIIKNVDGDTFALSSKVLCMQAFN